MNGERANQHHEGSAQTKREDNPDLETFEYVQTLLTDDMLKRLTQVADWEPAKPVLALAILRRIKRLWSILFGRQFLSTRIPGDEELFQTLRHSFFFQLEGRPRLVADASQAIPGALLTSAEMEILDGDINSHYESKFQDLESSLLALIVSEGTSTDTSQFQALLVTHDDWLDHIDEVVTKEFDNELIRLGLKKESSTKQLDRRIEQIELRLRQMIVNHLNNDERLVPPHVLNKMLERWSCSDRKNLSTKQSSLAGKLEYADLRELEAIVTNKICNSRFNPEFRAKQMVQRRFDQLAELRNCFRHSRNPDEVTLAEGKASVLWFERALDNGAEARER